MPINKGLKALAESDPDFSNQGLENAINNLKIGFAEKSITLDTAIQDNAHLTDSQKTDLKLTINNVAHLNIGRVLGDMRRHTNTVLDGSIIPITSTTEARSFLDLLQEVQSVQSSVADLFGVTASDKKRGVNDHFGTLNNKFGETDDSSDPLFTRLQNNLNFINSAGLTAGTAYQTALTNLINFLNTIDSDSTDHQQTLDQFATNIAGAATSFNSALASEPYLTKRAELINDTNEINAQVQLEKDNLLSIETYNEALMNSISFTSLAEDNDLRNLMARVAQNPNWQTYFNDYNANLDTLNPLYDVDSDSDKSSTIDLVLISRGLPDVLDPLDVVGVAGKAEKDDRIDTKGFDRLTAEQIIVKCCEQLGLDLFGDVYHKSERLLNNLNERDRQLIADELDANESSNTLN